MLPRQDKKFAHPGEAPGHTGKRKSESSHACSVTPRKSVRGDQFLGPPEAKALNGNLKTNPHRTLNLFKLAPISPQPRRTKEDGSFHTLCTFDADRFGNLIFQTPTAIEKLSSLIRIRSASTAITFKCRLRRLINGCSSIALYALASAQRSASVSRSGLRCRKLSPTPDMRSERRSAAAAS